METIRSCLPILLEIYFGEKNFSLSTFQAYLALFAQYLWASVYVPFRFRSPDFVLFYIGESSPPVSISPPLFFSAVCLIGIRWQNSCTLLNCGQRRYGFRQNR